MTVANNGNGPSDPVTASLNLPNGVTAAPGGTQSFGSRDLLASDGQQTVSCTGGTGTISCTSGIGLAPGESVTFRFELSAGLDATGGQITGSIMAGGGMAIQLTSVDVQVQQIDALDLTAQVWRHDFWTPRVDVAVTNQSTHAGTATVTVNAPHDGWLFTLAPCTHQDGTQIICTFDLARGQTTRFSVWVFRWHHRDDAVEIAASLGTAHKVISVPIDCDPAGGEMPPLPVPVVPVTPPSSVPLPTIPSTTSKQPTKTEQPPTPTTTPSKPTVTSDTPPPVRTTTTTPAPPTTTSPSSSTPPPPRDDPGAGLCLPLLDPRWPDC